jgi:hypothetical protein
LTESGIGGKAQATPRNSKQRFEVIDTKLDEITQMIKKISGEIEQLKKTKQKEAG